MELNSAVTLPPKSQPAPRGLTAQASMSSGSLHMRSQNGPSCGISCTRSMHRTYSNTFALDLLLLGLPQAASCIDLRNIPHARHRISFASNSAKSQSFQLLFINQARNFSTSQIAIQPVPFASVAFLAPGQAAAMVSGIQGRRQSCAGGYIACGELHESYSNFQRTTLNCS